jgi:hypothetical protein
MFLYSINKKDITRRENERMKWQVICLAKELLHITLHCSVSWQTAFFINSTVETSNHECTVMESNGQKQVSAMQLILLVSHNHYLITNLNMADPCLDFASGHFPMVLQYIL